MVAAQVPKVPGAPGAPDPEQLPALAMSRPAEAEACARDLLARTRDPLARSYALHALGIVLRDRDDLRTATAVLRRGLRTAERAHLSERRADLGATLGTTLVLAGRTAAADAAFATALDISSGTTEAKVRMRRAAVRNLSVGREREVLADLTAALRTFRRAGDLVWTARTLGNRGIVWARLGDVRRAQADLAEAEQVYARLDQPYGLAITRGDLAEVAFRAGDLPLALAWQDAADVAAERAGVRQPYGPSRRALILSAAGLHDEAVASSDVAVSLAAAAGPSARQAMFAVEAASVALAAGRPERARWRARQAAQAYTRSGNAAEATHARVLAALASASAEPSRARLREARALLDAPELSPDDRTELHLLLGQALAGRRGRTAAAAEHLAAAAAARRRGPPLSRARGWLAAARLAETRADRRGVLRACEAGLRVLDEHRLALGATELRAAATAHGRTLAELGLRHALATGRADTLLRWSERWRATALAVPPVRPPDDADLAADLAALRDVVRRLREARAEAQPTATLDRERRRLEESARRRTLRTRGEGAATLARHDTTALRAALGDSRLVELVAVDGRLHVVFVGPRGTRRFTAGALDAAAREVELARFGLHRVARPAPGAAGAALARAAGQSLGASADLLEELLLGPAAAVLGDHTGPLVMVPPGRLHAVPWGLLPVLRDREVTVAPSAAGWLRARRAGPAPTRAVTLVRGPGLGSGGAEVPELARGYPAARVLGDGHATAEAVLAALDGAALAHIAAHGEFRADNPMFSALTVDDGPLTVHDLCRLHRAPFRVVLSACESGLAASTGADELLGLASALVPLGTAGLLASVVPVNDAATVGVMLTVHDRLRSGDTLAGGLLAARRAAAQSGDPLAVATAAAFVALGAA